MRPMASHLARKRSGEWRPPPPNRTRRSVEDAYLSLGFYEKFIFRDSSSLFRAVADQVLLNQNLEFRLRKALAHYLRSHPLEFMEDFHQFVLSEKPGTDPEVYLNAIGNPVLQGGPLEVAGIARMLRLNIVVFSPNNCKSPIQAAIHRPESTACVYLGCQRPNYSVLLEERTPQAHAICQSIVYELLLEDVLGLEDVLQVAQSMLDEPAPQPLPPRMSRIDKFKTAFRPRLMSFRTAKAVVPSVFRNIELDVAAKVSNKRERRAPRMFSPSYRPFTLKDGPQAGMKCLISVDGLDPTEDENALTGYIQDAPRDGSDTVTVFCENSASIVEVPLRYVRAIPCSGEYEIIRSALNDEERRRELEARMDQPANPPPPPPPPRRPPTPPVVVDTEPDPAVTPVMDPPPSPEHHHPPQIPSPLPMTMVPVMSPHHWLTPPASPFAPPPAMWSEQAAYWGEPAPAPYVLSPYEAPPPILIPVFTFEPPYPTPSPTMGGAFFFPSPAPSPPLENGW